MSRAGRSSGAGRRDPDEIARMVQAGLAAGMDVVEAVRAARAGKPSSRDARALDREHRRSLAVHEQAVSRHQRAVARRRGRATTFTAAAGAFATMGVLDLVTAGATGANAVPGEPWAWLLAAGGSALVAVRARMSLTGVRAPALTTPTPAPPPVLPAGARGRAEADRLMRARVKLAQLAPAVAGLHPGAGEELRCADAEAAPALGALVERLAVLGGIEKDMPGTAASAAAVTAAEDVRLRLATGVDTYERLIAAAAALLAAPDLGRSSDAVLGPAIDAMAAYTEGLAVSADLFRP